MYREGLKLNIVCRPYFWPYLFAVLCFYHFFPLYILFYVTFISVLLWFREVAKKTFVSGPATKAPLPPPLELSGHIFFVFFSSFKKVICLRGPAFTPLLVVGPLFFCFFLRRPFFCHFKDCGVQRGVHTVRGSHPGHHLHLHPHLFQLFLIQESIFIFEQLLFAPMDSLSMFYM